MPSRCFGITAHSLLLLAACQSLAAQSYTETNDAGPLAPSLAAGLPATSYALSGIDNINYYNGDLNVHIPVLPLGGRGSAGHLIYIPIERRWTVANIYTNGATSYQPETVQGAYLSGTYTSGFITVNSASAQPNSCIVTDSQGAHYAGLGPFLTWIVWHAPDRSETMLVDTTFNGQPQNSSITQCSQLNSYQPANRHRTFRSTDGSYLTFVADSDVLDGSGVVTGTLYFHDGTHYRIGSDGYVSKIEDRNGNVLSYSFQSNSTGGTYTVQDSAGRTEMIVITEDPANNSQDVIKYSGTGGAQRSITVNYALLQSVLSSGETLRTYACLFPELNGSSTTDFNPYVVSSIVLADGHSYAFQYNSYGELAKVTLPTGGAYQYKYSEVSGCSGAGSGVISIGQDAHYSIYRRVVERDELADGSTISAKTLFTATPVSGIDPNHSGRAGTKVQVDFEDGSGTLLRRENHYFYGDPTAPNSVPAVDTNYPAWPDGLEFKTEVSDGTSTLSTQQRLWGQRPCGSDANCWFDPQADASPSHDPQRCQANTQLDSGQTSGTVFGYDQFDNQTDSYEFDYGAAPAIGATCPVLSSLTGYKRHSVTAYKTDAAYVAPNVNLVSLAISKTVYDGSNSQAAQDLWTYDQGSPVSALGVAGHDDTSYGTANTVRGNLTQHQAWWNTTGALISENLTYDVTGNPLTYSDFKSNVTTLTYGDVAHVSPTRVVNPLGASLGMRTYSYDQSTLKLISATDENGAVTNYLYGDSLERLTLVTQAAGTTVESRTAYSYPSTTQVTTKQDQLTAGDAAVRVDAIYDGLGRPKETDQYESAGAYIATTTTYDGLGRVHTTTNPSRSGDNLNFPTMYTYDALGRLKSVQTPDAAATATIYSGNQSTTTDPAGNAKQYTSDALGRLTQVTEDPSGFNYITSYAYDALDNLKTVTQDLQTRTFNYDSLSRLTSATNPENGTTSYGYDGNGNVIYRSDGRGRETCYSIDAVNRVTLQVYFTGNVTAGATGQCGSIPAANYSTDTPNVAYAYDSGVSNAKGRLVSATSSAAANQIGGYDQLGQVTGSSQIIGGLTYSFGYAYNRAGVLTSITYPSGRVIATAYDGANRPNSLTGTKNGTPTTYLSGLSYAPHGGFGTFTLGNQLTRNHTYNNRLQPTELTDRVPSQNNPLLDLQYFYGGSTVVNGSSTLNNGNITQVNIGASLSGTTSASFTQTYGYDKSNRLQSAGETGSSAWSEQFGYDRYGNMWLSSASGLFTQPLMPSSQSAYTNPPTNQLAGVAYDGAGNQLMLGGSQLAYDSENRQISATDTTSGRTTAYAYDGLGERVSKSVGSMPTVYVYDAFGNLAAEYGSSPISSCTTCYLSWDHLGSTRTMTDQNGQVISRHDYLPFGSEIPAGYAGRTSPWGSNDSLAQKFTSQERDTETGLDFFQARYLGSAQGRFLSADPANAGADPANPQSWNMYSYTLNNPMKFIDPTGMACVYSGSGDTTDPNNFYDDNNGGQNCADAFASLPQQLTVTENSSWLNEVSSLWNSFWSYTPIQYENDVPLNPFAQQLVKAVGQKINAYPTICGGGWYSYGGRELEAGPVSGFAGVITEHDSRAGTSSGALFEGGYGEGIVGGVGYVGATTGEQAQGTGLAYVGVGGKSKALSGSAGIVGFGTSSTIGGVGVYGEGFRAGRGGGFGAYVNISSVGSCH